MTRENSIQFRLDGMDYLLRGDKSPEQLAAIVRLVEQKVTDIRRQAPAYSGVRTSTLAALQLAEELLEAQEEYAALLREADIGARFDFRPK